MPQRVALLNVVGLSAGLVGEHTPRLRALADRDGLRHLVPPLPAVTCSVQATMLTGQPPRTHGIVGNGWYDRTLAEVHFWKQSNRLVAGEKVWETARHRDPAFTCANLFWWFNMHSSVDVAVTPRPMYPADGRKVPDVYTQPPELRHELQSRLGTFPLFKFWGPGASIESSRWIADAALQVEDRFHPTLALVYLPHLDYPLQKVGPDHASIPGELRAIDGVIGSLLDAYERSGVKVLVVSEYGIEPVDNAVWINRTLREAGFLAWREELGREILDPGGSRAFAVADHQVAHVYVRDPADLPAVADCCRSQPGVDTVLDRDGQAAIGVDHPRAGDLVLVAAPRCWFAYGWWSEDDRAPDYARTVDIHRKPGYDPLELFLDPALSAPRLRIGWKLLKRRLGFRTLLDVIPLRTDLVRGSHGRVDTAPGLEPVLLGVGRGDAVPAAEVRNIVLDALAGR
ncbi:MAG: alkaline phosphatase family protein [Phycisphaerales bacterium]|nr:alkaline phosphatase family protein [Phycisphaerales bacterium]